MSAEDVESGPVHEFEDRPRRAPYRFRIGASPVITVQEPDAGTVMDIEETNRSRVALRYFLGEQQYEEVEEHILGCSQDTLREVLQKMSQHFGMIDAETAATVNRAARRRRGR